MVAACWLVGDFWLTSPHTHTSLLGQCRSVVVARRHTVISGGGRETRVCVLARLDVIWSKLFAVIRLVDELSLVEWCSRTLTSVKRRGRGTLIDRGFHKGMPAVNLWMYVVTAFGSAVGGDHRTHLVAGRSAFKRTFPGSAQTALGEKQPPIGLGLGLRPESEVLYSPPLKSRAVEASFANPQGQQTAAPPKSRTMSGKTTKDNGSPLSPLVTSTNGKNW